MFELQKKCKFIVSNWKILILRETIHQRSSPLTLSLSVQMNIAKISL